MDPETEASLFEWAAKLSVFQDNHIQPTAEHFKDGIMLGKILKTIIDPEYFKELNYSTENSTPLIKIVEKMKRYLATKVSYYYYSCSVVKGLIFFMFMFTYEI